MKNKMNFFGEKKGSTLWQIILGIALATIVGVIGFFVFLQKTTVLVKVGDNYYQDLKEECNRKPGSIKNCCLDSVKTMEIVGGTILNGSKTDAVCPKGKKRMALRCPGSYTWCQPFNDIPDVDGLVLPTEPMIINEVSIDNDVNHTIKPIEIKLPSNVISEKDCTLQGGEVWNTLGETSYNGKLIGKVEGLNCPCACLVENLK